MKYAKVICDHNGFRCGTILELVRKKKMFGWVWYCNCPGTDFETGGELVCDDRFIKIITKEKDPEEFL